MDNSGREDGPNPMTRALSKQLIDLALCCAALNQLGQEIPGISLACGQRRMAAWLAMSIPAPGLRKSLSLHPGVQTGTSSHALACELRGKIASSQSALTQVFLKRKLIFATGDSRILTRSLTSESASNF